jgi:1-acyl-sn-glycerol-3-phosphate acyltransferase
VSVQNKYPIVPVALVGGDDVYQNLLSRDGQWGRLSLRLTEKVFRRKDTPLPLLRGVGPTLLPRPRRMYLRFGAPIETTKPARVSEEKWVATVKQTTQEALERAIADLLEIRSRDPYRELNPLAWRAAIQSVRTDAESLDTT